MINEGLFLWISNTELCYNIVCHKISIYQYWINFFYNFLPLQSLHMSYHEERISNILKVPNSKGSGKTVLANYTTSNLALKSGKVLTTVVSNMRLNWVGYILHTLD